MLMTTMVFICSWLCVALVFREFMLVDLMHDIKDMARGDSWIVALIGWGLLVCSVIIGLPVIVAIQTVRLTEKLLKPVLDDLEDYQDMMIRFSSSGHPAIFVFEADTQGVDSPDMSDIKYPSRTLNVATSADLVVLVDRAKDMAAVMKNRYGGKGRYRPDELPGFLAVWKEAHVKALEDAANNDEPFE